MKRRRRFSKTAGGLYRTEVRHPTERDANGRAKRITITRSTEEELERAIGDFYDLRKRHDAGLLSTAEARRIVLGGAPISVAEAWRMRLEAAKVSYRPNLSAIWVQRVEPFLGHLACRDLSDARLADWADALKKAGYAPRTVIDSWLALRKTVARLIPDYLPEEPWREFRPPRDPVPPEDKREGARSIEEVVLLARAAAGRDRRNEEIGLFSDLANRLLVKFLLGLRQGEGAGLGWKDCTIDLPPPYRCEAYIWRQAKKGWRTAHPEWTEPRDPPKGDKTRHVTIDPACRQILLTQREHLQRWNRYRPDGPVFPGNGAEWRSSELIEPAVFRELVLEAGLPNPGKWTPHSMRHSRGTIEAIISGGDPRAVQAMLGHASLIPQYMKRAGRGVHVSKLGEQKLDFGVPLLPPPAAFEAAADAETMARVFAAACLDVASATSNNTLAIDQLRDDNPSRAERRRRRKLDAKGRQRANRRERAEGAFAIAWEAWVAREGEGRVRELVAEGRRPAPITAAAEADYSRAYRVVHAAASRGTPGESEEARKARLEVAREEARKVGNRARTGLLANWRKYVLMKLKAEGESGSAAQVITTPSLP